MHCFCFVILCTLMFQNAESSSDDKYGAILRITKKGLTYAANTAFPEYWSKKDIKLNFSIPRVNETADDVNYFIESLHLMTKMDNESFKVSVDIEEESKCVKISIHDSLATFEGKVQCRHIKDRSRVQNCSITMNIPWYFKVHIGMNKSGNFSSSVCKGEENCLIPVSDMNISYDNCAPSEEQLCTQGEAKFEKIFKEQLKKYLKLLDVCTHIESFVITTLNKQMQTIELMPHIKHLFVVDIHMSKEPTYYRDFIETYHKGDVYWYSTMEKYPTLHANVTLDADNSKMLYIWVSKYAMESFFRGIQLHGMLHFTIKAEHVGLHNRSLSGLNTTCSTGVCVGRLLPMLEKLYPNCFMDLDVYSVDVPKMNFEKNLAVVEGKMVMFVYVRNPYLGNSTLLANLTGTVNLRFNISMDSAAFHGEVAAFDPDLQSIHSFIEGFDIQTVDFILRSAVVVTVEPILNDYGRKGLDFPVRFTEVQNAEVKLIENAMVIGCDIKHHRKEDN
ncbi:lipopolysaccharide-binding protein-like isoform X2 [Ostrea edulis]|nr:lipopolysaccharide-binding protein-like isoform X2 [Ostrea edulis]XP_056022666.1 lipopolysaccharide-binding protein-like isoform X2 [Ostrea edulis]